MVANLHSLYIWLGEDRLCATDHAYKLEYKLLDIHNFVRKHLNVSSESMKRRYDVKMHKIAYKVEDAFWYSNSKQKVGFSPNLQRRLKGTMNAVDILNDVY